MTLHGGKRKITAYLDVTMDSYNGTEACKLVGSYILSILSKNFKNNIGLYGDDGLASLTV